MTALGAEAYSAWLARTTGEAWRLPSAAEWRGAHGDAHYPWGDRWQPDSVCALRVGVPGCMTVDVSEMLQGAGPWGHLHMAGNVREWVADRDGRSRGLLLGGGWADGADGLGSGAEVWDDIDYADADTGFRVLRD